MILLLAAQFYKTLRYSTVNTWIIIFHFQSSWISLFPKHFQKQTKKPKDGTKTHQLRGCKFLENCIEFSTATKIGGK